MSGQTDPVKAAGIRDPPMRAPVKTVILIASIATVTTIVLLALGATSVGQLPSLIMDVRRPPIALETCAYYLPPWLLFFIPQGTQSWPCP